MAIASQPFLRPALLLVSLLAAQPVLAEDWKQAFKQPDQPATALSTPPPGFPSAEAWYGLSGQVTLIVVVDESGMPGRLEIEQTSGLQGLDAAAIEGARHWRFVPGKLRGKPIASLVRVPVRFEVPDAYLPDRISHRPQDGYFLERRGARAVAPASAVVGSGLLPAYVPDTYPVGVTSVAAAAQLLERYAHREADAIPGVVTEYTLRDEEGLSHWNLVIAGPSAPAVVRRRLVGDGEFNWFVTSFLCEGDAAGCAMLEQLMKSAPSQSKLSVLPPPSRTRYISP